MMTNCTQAILTLLVVSCGSVGRTSAQQDTLDQPPIEEPPPTQEVLEAAWMQSPVRVPGTKLSLIPPPGFSLAKNFNGFEKDAVTGLIIMDLEGGNFYSNTATYTEEKWQEKGAQVVEFENVRVGGYTGIRALIKSPVDGSFSHQLVFGDTTFSALITSTWAVIDTNTSNEIRRALSTVTYDKALIVSPYEGTTFRLNDRSTELKFAKKGGGAWLYSPDGISKVSYGDEPFLMALPLPFSPPMSCRSIAEKMITGLEEKGFNRTRVEKESTDRVNGFDAYEAEYYGVMQGSETLIYMLVVSFGDRSVVIEGRASEPFSPALKAFKELALTVSFQ